MHTYFVFIQKSIQSEESITKCILISTNADGFYGSSYAKESFSLKQIIMLLSLFPSLGLPVFFEFSTQSKNLKWSWFMCPVINCNFFSFFLCILSTMWIFLVAASQNSSVSQTKRKMTTVLLTERSLKAASKSPMNLEIGYCLTIFFKSNDKCNKIRKGCKWIKLLTISPSYLSLYQWVWWFAYQNRFIKYNQNFSFSQGIYVI